MFIPSVERNIPVYNEMCMRIQGSFDLVVNCVSFELIRTAGLGLEMGIGIALYHVPMLGSESDDRQLKQACFRFPILLMKVLALSAIGHFGAFTFIFAFAIPHARASHKLMNRRIYILVERVL